MQAGVARAERTIAVLSPAYLDSEYGTAEWEAAWASDPAGRQRKLLPENVQSTCKGAALYNKKNSSSGIRQSGVWSTAS